MEILKTQRKQKNTSSHVPTCALAGKYLKKATLSNCDKAGMLEMPSTFHLTIIHRTRPSLSRISFLNDDPFLERVLEETTSFRYKTHVITVRYQQTTSSKTRSYDSQYTKAYSGTS